jgi:hypothetical protein
MSLERFECVVRRFFPALSLVKFMKFFKLNVDN